MGEMINSTIFTAAPAEPKTKRIIKWNMQKTSALNQHRTACSARHLNMNANENGIENISFTALGWHLCEKQSLFRC